MGSGEQLISTCFLSVFPELPREVGPVTEVPASARYGLGGNRAPSQLLAALPGPQWCCEHAVNPVTDLRILQDHSK